MPRVTHTVNTVNFETNKVVSHDDFLSMIEFIKDTYSVDKPDLFWIKSLSERLFETAVFFALNSEMKGFDCSEALTLQLKGIEGMTNTYAVDFAPSLEFTKDNFFKQNGLGIVSAQVERLANYGSEYGVDKKLDFKAAVDYLKVMDKRTAQYKQLTEDAQVKVNIRKEKIDAIWNKVDMLQAREYPDAEISAIYDIPETQIYHMVGKTEQTFESARRSLQGKASVAGMEDNKRNEDFFLQSSASAGLVARYCASLIKDADTIDQTNVQDEISRDMAGTGENATEVARQQYESENGLPHGTIGNGSSNGDSQYDGTTEDTTEE